MFTAHFIRVHGEDANNDESAANSEGVFRTTRQWRSRAGELRHAQLNYAPVPGETWQAVASLVQVEDITKRGLALPRDQALIRSPTAPLAPPPRHTPPHHPCPTAVRYNPPPHPPHTP